MEPVVLRTDRLELALPTSGDVEVMTEYCQDPEIVRFVPIPQPYTHDSARGFIERFVPRAWASGAEYNWAIRERSGETDAAAGRFLGMIGARPAADDGSVDVGYWLGAQHRGQGFVPEAARAVIEWLGAELGTRRVTWWALPGNAASRRVAEKLGFAFAGTRPVEGGFRGTPAEAWFAELRLTR